MIDISPTPEQRAILSAALSSQSSLMVQALAGCAKTTTIEMIANALPEQPALAVAFNKKIKLELERRFPPHFKIMTLNGLGHLAWAKALGYSTKITLDDRKLPRLLNKAAANKGVRLEGGAWADCLSVVHAAQLAGIVPSTYPQKGLLPDTLSVWDEIATDEVLGLTVPFLELCRNVLLASVKEAFDGTISFDDQIYMSTMFNGVFPQYPLVMVDEAQDLSPLNHIQVARSAGLSGRLIVVGDNRQAIYQFRGADALSMAKLKALRKDWIELPLNTTFRCPKLVVARQQQHAPGFTAFESNAVGEVLDWRTVEAGDPGIPKWNLNTLEPFLSKDSALLCRNNGPLFTMAMRLLRQGIGCVMLGRDIGKNLISLSKRIAPGDGLSSDDTIEAIQAWASSERQKLLAEEKEYKLVAVEDRAESLLAVMRFGPCESAGELRAKLAELFDRESGALTLGSIHRAKGLEWTNVMIIDPWRIPSHFARKAQARGDNSQMQQELNLRYVCETRAKHTLILANLEDFTT